MTYEQYQLMFYIALAACIILFLLTVILFFALKIPRAFGDITGLSRKKAIKNLNEQSEKAKISGSASEETDRISPSGRIISDYTGNTVITEKIETERITGGNETTVLSENIAETTVLSGNIAETTVLFGNAEETTMLNGFGTGETTLLTENTMFMTPETEPLQPLGIVVEKGFAKEIQSIIFIHTGEIVG